MDAAAQARVQALTQEVVVSFGEHFTKAYIECIVAKCKREANALPSGYQLLVAPLANDSLKAGTMTKDGGSMFKNWKTRHFVALNHADNYAVEYFDKEGGKKKGTIGCAGYQVRIFSQPPEKHYDLAALAKLAFEVAAGKDVNAPEDNEGKKWGSDFGITLYCYGTNRREWHLRCTSLEEETAWAETLKSACRWSGPLKNKNPLIAQAFDIAYWRTRWQYCLWGSYNPWGSEDERLANLIVCILEREVVWDIVCKIQGSYTVRRMLESAIRTPIEIAVNAAVGGSWTGLCTACAPICTKMEELLKASLAPLLEQEAKLKTQIVDGVSSIVNPVLADKAGGGLRPFLQLACDPIAVAFTQSARHFKDFMSKMIADNEFAEDKFDQGISHAYGRSYWELCDSYQTINHMCFTGFGPLLASLAEMCAGFDLWNVYYTIRNSLDNIYRNAIYTFKVLVKGVEEDAEKGIVAVAPIGLGPALNEVIRRYIADCMHCVVEVVCKVMRGLLEFPIMELMIKPAKMIVAPIEEVVKAIPVINVLINVTSMTTECIERIIHSFLSEMITSGFGSVMNGHFASVRE